MGVFLPPEVDPEYGLDLTPFWMFAANQQRALLFVLAIKNPAVPTGER
jgi:hypothetical protein